MVDASAKDIAVLVRFPSVCRSKQAMLPPSKAVPLPGCAENDLIRFVP
jgi:hypothetical protein